ncbi:MAG: TIGR04282 family arsenosugar biosynthesis glycosyltransferase [Planctomycetota bacterium]
MKTLGLFGKHPLPGHVKTRLADEVGTEVATKLYAAFMDDLAFRFRAAGDNRILGFWPTDSVDFFDQYVKLGYELWPQPEGDLGQKIISFYKYALKEEGSRAVLIGSDSPTLPSEFVDQAFELLNEVDCVLGPATDGGYYLIGLRRPSPALFENIAWSGANVLVQTVQRATTAGLSLNLLTPWYDVDDLKGLQVLAGHIRAMTHAGQTHPCPVTASVLEQIHLLERPVRVGMTRSLAIRASIPA